MNRLNTFYWAGILPLFGHTFGGINTLFSLKYITWEEYLENNKVHNADFIIALTIIFFFFNTCMLMGFMFNKKLSRYISLLKSNIYTKTVNWAIFIIVLVQFYLIISGTVFIKGLNTDISTENVPILFTILIYLAPIVPFWLGQNFRQKNFKNNFIYILILFEFFFFLFNGKNSALGFILFMFLGYFTDEKIDWKNYIKLKYIAVSIVVVITVLSLFKMYNFIRVIEIDNKALTVGTIWDLYEVYNNTDTELIDNSYENYKSIRGVLGLESISLASRIFKNDLGNHLYGKDFFNSILEATPGNWFVNKEANLTGELLYMREYKGYFEQQDTGNSIALQGYFDFGLLGVFLYGIFFCLVIMTILNILFYTKNDFLQILGFIAILRTCTIQHEYDITNLFLLFRSILIILLLFYIYRIIIYFLKGNKNSKYVTR